MAAMKIKPDQAKVELKRKGRKDRERSRKLSKESFSRKKWRKLTEESMPRNALKGNGERSTRMKHRCHCKTCMRPITVEIDAAYAPLGDSLKLVRMATCSACFERRERQHRIEATIQRAYTWLQFGAGPVEAKEMAKLRDALVMQAKR